MRTDFRFCPNCGSRLALRRIEFHDLPACLRCGFVAWKGPKVAVALLASDERGRLLAIRRGMPPGAGGWAFPGGYVDDLEEPAAGAARECLEETRCRTAVGGLLGAFHVVTEEGALVVLAYRGTLTGGEPTPTEEASELGCFSPAELPELVFSSHRQALEAWLATRDTGS
ncbi:MAG: NUDIX hydrolase [Candidatus Dormibacteria bacterium]